MNNKGSVRDNSLFRHIKIFMNKVGTSYIYKLVSKILSFLGTILLIFLVVIGSLMFYFNSKAKAYQRQGVNYVPPFGLYTIISGSMEPSIHVYDVVVSVSERDLSKIKVGDIITFISTWDVNYGKTITHRVVSVSKNTQGEYHFTTKGDNNESADGATVSQANFVGKVVLRLPQLGRLQFFLATKSGWFLVVFIPALGVIIYDVFKILKLVVLKKEINNVSNVGDLNSDGTYKDPNMVPSNMVDNQAVVAPMPAMPATPVATQEVVSIVPNQTQPETFTSYELNNQLASNIGTQDSGAMDVASKDLEETVPLPIQVAPLGPAEEIVAAFEPEGEVKEEVQTVVASAPAPIVQNNQEIAPAITRAETSIPTEKVDNLPQANTNEIKLPENKNIVQTNTNRAPILRRSERKDDKEANKQTSVPNTNKESSNKTVVDLEDLQNIELPVMKANANFDDEGPLTKRK